MKINTTKRFGLMMLAAVCAQYMSADNITALQAESVARKFLSSMGVQIDGGVHRQQAPRHTRAGAAAAPYYVFTGTDGAWCIVSGESGTREVLAYGLKGGFDATRLAPGVVDLLEDYAMQIEALRTGMTAAPALATASGEGVCLNTAAWDQTDSFWWSQCPTTEINGKTYNTHVGCIPAAMAIIMRHYCWPEHGYGSHSYVWDNKKVSADFENTYYNLASLPLGNADDEQWTDETRQQVATLLHHAGVAVEAIYSTGNTSAAEPHLGMYRHFGYKMGFERMREEQSDAQWIEMIETELDGGHPLLYSARRTGGGHQFVCDGYDASGRLHFNFGWSGDGNGYYSIDAIKVAGYNYVFDHTAIFGMHPDYDVVMSERSPLYMQRYGTDNFGRLECDAEKVRPEQTFNVTAHKLQNVSWDDFNGSVAVFLCSADGQRKAVLGTARPLRSIGADSYWSECTVPCHFYTGLEPEDGDVLQLFTSTDGSKTWQPVKCWDNAYERIVPPVLVPVVSQLELVDTPDGKKGEFSATTAGALQKNTIFYVQLQNLRITSLPFFGEIGLLLCDKDGNIKYDQSVILTAYSVNLPNVESSHDGSHICMIPGTFDMQPSDRLYLCSRLTGETEWHKVTYANGSYAFIGVDPDDIQGVIGTWGKAEYYTIDGVRVAGTNRQGLYIIRQAGKSRKVMQR